MEVKFLLHLNGQGREQFVLCRSQSRPEKEKAMLARQEQRLWQKLLAVHQRLEMKPAPADGIDRRADRRLGRSPAADKLFEMEDYDSGRRVSVTRRTIPVWAIAIRNPAQRARTWRSREDLFSG